MCLEVCIWIAVPGERHLMFQVVVVVRTIAVTTFQKYYGENGANEENNAECANENEEPGFVNTQIGVPWKFKVFNMVGI